MTGRASILSSRDSYDPTTRLQPSNGSVHRSRSRSLQRQDSTRQQHQDLTTLSGNPGTTSPLAASFDLNRSDSIRGPQQDHLSLGSRRGSDEGGLHRSMSATSRTSMASGGVSRSNTLKKQKSLSRKGSLKRSSSRRSVTAGSIGGVTYDDTTGDDQRSVFYTPVPTSGSPTEILAARFQGWRKVLKDLMIVFREVQASYEAKSKATTKLQNAVANISMPLGFLQEGGIGEASTIFQQHYKQVVSECIKAKEIEQDVISQLASLRNDLNQKIKEIKSLSGDFKNNIEKEKNNTKKAIHILQQTLANVDQDSKAMVGKDDPYIVRMMVERQVERQIDEENYLHRAYLNIEGSGRELEAIVVGEIQKAYRAFATIIRKEADDAYDSADRLTTGPINMEKDFEWSSFVSKDPHFSSQNIPLRRAQDLEYPGKFHPATTEVRAGMLERKSKYLKSYTPGWYVLSPTHLHEFKSADSVYTQAPIMSLYLPDQKLGAHSQPDSNSHKFILKGRQTGSMHRGHSWVFRAESYDTMLAWYDDIKELTEKTGEERNNFVRRHTRSYSTHSGRSISSFDDDEADRIPYNAGGSGLMTGGINGETPGPVTPVQEQRPQGGRFPSDLQMRNTSLPLRVTTSSDDSDAERNIDSSGIPQTPSAAIASEQGFTGGLARVGGQQQQHYSNPPGHASRKVNAYETPAPIQNRVPEPQAAEYVTTTPFQAEVHPAIVTGSISNPSEKTAIEDEVVTDNVGYFGVSDGQKIAGKAIPDGSAAVSSAPLWNSVAPTEKIKTEAAVRASSPGLRRKDTDQSVSNLHVPGEYPKVHAAA